ncbi:hypothetical protein [Methylacidimicrobium sp. B4]|uniref:hypothetical protein n=1 Tax=Methylacidimicrobium sp. B4 TaxID=2796139 RepID=UPI001A8D6992|nr:hypothetical protein [Methylacidimicrobium sp. B4]QSR85399.1 hypothetical protein MacB4_03925 [Methylacidimicrobium sp. B4]
MENSQPPEGQGEEKDNKTPSSQPSPEPTPKEGKPTDKTFYWVVALASLFFLYLFYSVLFHDTVNIHGH